MSAMFNSLMLSLNDQMYAFCGIYGRISGQIAKFAVAERSGREAILFGSNLLNESHPSNPQDLEGQLSNSLALYEYMS